MPQADTLILNGKVFTADPQQPWADAVAIQGNRIAWVGSQADASAWRGANTRVLDAGGGTVMPGFIDSHFHLLAGSLQLDSLHLDTAESSAEIAEHVRVWAAANADAPWLLGYQLRYGSISPEQPLDRHFLDAIMPDRPVYLTAFDEHTVWTNTVALERGGLLYGAAVPAGSEIVMAADGTATGELREPARLIRCVT